MCLDAFSTCTRDTMHVGVGFFFLFSVLPQFTISKNRNIGEFYLNPLPWNSLHPYNDWVANSWS